MSRREWKPGDVATVDGAPITFYEETSTGRVMFTNPHGFQYPAKHLHSSARPLVVIDPEAVLSGWNAENIPALLEACAQIVTEHAAPREVHETTLLLNLVRAFDEALGTGISEPTDPTARVTDRRDNVWRLLADGEWVCTSGPDIGGYLAWSGLVGRGPLGVEIP